VALTLVVLVAPRSYHCKLTVIIQGTLGHHLLSVNSPCRERKLIARSVDFLLTSEFVQLMWYSLGEAYLKVGLPGWRALLNYNLALNCVNSPRRFSSQFCKIESTCLIGLAKVFHSWLSSEQDNVLLEIRNRNEARCLWSLIATTSLNLPIMSLPHGQTLWGTYITMFVSSPFSVTSDDWCVHHTDQGHSLMSWLSSIFILVVLQGTSSVYFSSFSASSGCQC
jgi:hypothetical protein